MAKGNSGKGKGQKREDLERKRDERSRRRDLKKGREIKEYLENDENFASFKNQLEAIGLKIKDILGDGNCLFRALGDQLNGDHTAHAYHRRNAVQYMKGHREDFEPFMEDGVTFEKHLQELSKMGTYGGNDSIVAFARNNGVDIVIHQLNTPRWVIHGSEYSKTPQIIELHLAYHNGEHYSSVRKLSDPDNGPAWQHHSEKSMVQPLDKVAANKENSSKTKKKKEQKKKEKTLEEPAATCTGEDCQGLEQIVMDATGCQDMKLIKETLQENNFEVDVSIGYVLQLMSVLEDQNCAVESGTSTSCASSNGDNQQDIKTSSSNESNSNDFNGADLVSNSLEIITDRTGNISSSKEEDDCKDCNTEKQGTNALNEFVDKLRESLTETDSEKSKNEMLKQGARPKETMKKNSSNLTTHISNRQRKELAKQEKKKRREERRKDEGQKENDSHVVAAIESKSDSLPDLGAVCI